MAPVGRSEFIFRARQRLCVKLDPFLWTPEVKYLKYYPLRPLIREGHTHTTGSKGRGQIIIENTGTRKKRGEKDDAGRVENGSEERREGK